MMYANPNTGESFEITGNTVVNLSNSLRSQRKSTQDYVWDQVRKLETHVPNYEKKVKA